MRNEILELLEKNSRLSPAEIAAMLNMDETEVIKPVFTLIYKKLLTK